MSRIYFHSEHETVEVYGTERAWMGCLVSRIAGGVFDMLSHEDKLALVPEGHYLRRPDNEYGWNESFRTWLTVMDGNFADGTSAFATALNTVLAIGSPPLQLAARLHGQCEMHAWVEGEHGDWMADLIEEGLRTGIFRLGRDRENRWADVVRLLRESRGPVVTSYSVCEGFPNPSVADWTPPQCETCRSKPPSVRDKCDECCGEPLWDAWYDLAAAEQWKLAMKGLREEDSTPQITPENWPWHFRNGKTAFAYLLDQP